MSAFRDILIQFILQEINKHSTLETCTLLLKVLRRYFSLLQPSSCQNQDFISEERFKNEEQQKKKHNANLVQNLKITVFSFPLFFFFFCYTLLLHVLFFSALFLPEEEREVCIFPVSKHVSVRTQRSLKQLAFKRYSPMFTVIIRKWPRWTRARSSTSLCCWRLHPESEAKKTTRFQHPRTVPFSFSEARIISESAQKQRQNRTQVVVSTQRVIFPQRCDCLCFLFVLFFFFFI